MVSSSENPYAAPRTTSIPPQQINSDQVPWGTWISGTAVGMILLTATALYLDANHIGNIDPGPHTAMLSGLGLVIVSVWIGRRYAAISAIVLAELLNLTVWLTMLLTVLVLSPIIDDQQLRADDIKIFGMIWACGAAGTAVIVLLFGRRTAKPTKDVSREF